MFANGYKCMHLSEQACAFEGMFIRMCACADVRVHVWICVHSLDSTQLWSPCGTPCLSPPWTPLAWNQLPGVSKSPAFGMAVDGTIKPPVLSPSHYILVESSQ